MLDGLVYCLCCGGPTLINMKTWNEKGAPVAVCVNCLFLVTRPMLRAIYLLRGQMQALSSQLAEANDHIRKLYQAQQELEQACLE